MKSISQPNKLVRYIDLFCGIGGFRIAMENACRSVGLKTECMFSSDIDIECQKAYSANFKDMPKGDITRIEVGDIPKHDILLAGFPCQPFSIIGQMKGFEDARGTLFFEIAKILKEKRPKAFVLENVKLLVGHDGGRTIAHIMQILNKLQYRAEYRVLNAMEFGLPQKRERVFIVGFREKCNFNWPNAKVPMMPLSKILEKKVSDKYYASEYIKKKRLKRLEPTKELTIWHENKAGHVSAYPYSCALRAGASYNYLLVNGERRLTPREMLRLQGFPDSYKIVCNDSQVRKQAGNSLPVPVAQAVINKVVEACMVNSRFEHEKIEYSVVDGQLLCFEEQARYNERTKTKNSRKIQTPVSA